MKTITALTGRLTEVVCRAERQRDLRAWVASTTSSSDDSASSMAALGQRDVGRRRQGRRAGVAGRSGKVGDVVELPELLCSHESELGSDFGPPPERCLQFLHRQSFTEPPVPVIPVIQQRPLFLSLERGEGGGVFGGPGGTPPGRGFEGAGAPRQPQCITLGRLAPRHYAVRRRPRCPRLARRGGAPGPAPSSSGERDRMGSRCPTVRSPHNVLLHLSKAVEATEMV